MQDDLQDKDPRAIWQNQPTEVSEVTLEKIRQKVRDLRAKTRRQLLGNLSLLLVVGFFYVFDVKQSLGMQPLFLLAIAWSLAGLYFLNRGMWSMAMPGDAALSTGLEFYRREVERQRYLFRRVLMWSFGPVLLAIGAFIAALSKVITKDWKIFPNAMPFMTLVVIWIAAYFVIRKRERHILQREIDELKTIEKENKR